MSVLKLGNTEPFSAHMFDEKEVYAQNNLTNISINEGQQRSQRDPAAIADRENQAAA